MFDFFLDLSVMTDLIGKSLWATEGNVGAMYRILKIGLFCELTHFNIIPCETFKL